MKGAVIMRIRGDYTKSYHAKIMNADLRRERMLKSVPEDARKIFNRKPYQIGGSESELSNGKKD